MENVVEIRHYLTRRGKDAFGVWSSSRADARTQAKIAARINRLAAGNFGDCKRLRNGVCELRIDWGPGYRVYYAMSLALGCACLRHEEKERTANHET